MPPRKINPGPDAKPTPRVSPPGAEDSGIGRLPPQPDNEPLPGNLPGRLGDWVSSLGRDLDAPERDRFERDIRRILRSVAMTDSLFPRGPGTLSPPLLVTGGGSTRLDRSGVSVYNGNVNTIRLEDDGDAFFGSNLAAPATTSFIVFSNAQTYNSESMGAGDVLLGDNSTSKANILWDASAGKLLFRGGLVDNVVVDTDGGLEIDSTGFSAAAEKRPLRIINTTHSHHLQLTNFDLNVDLAGGSIGMRVPNPGGAVTYPSVATSFVADTAGLPNIHYVLDSVATSATDNVQAFVVADVTNTLAKFYLVGAGVFAGTERLGIGLAPTVPLQVKSGVFIQAGAAGATIFNEDSYDIDFRVESDGNANMLFVDGGTDRIGIGTGAPAVGVHISGSAANFAFIRLENTAASGAAGGGVFQLVSNDAAAVVAGDLLGQVLWAGYTGTNVRTGASIKAYASTTFSETDTESTLRFYTVPTGSITQTEVVRMLSNQTLQLPSANSWTANGTGTVTISNLAPAGVGTATISKWLTITDNAGVVMYVPCWT